MRSKLARWISSAAFTSCIVVSACSPPSSFDRASVLLDDGHFGEAAKLFAEAKSDPRASSEERLSSAVGYLASLACGRDGALTSAYLEIARERDGAAAQVVWRRAVPNVLSHKRGTDALELIECGGGVTDSATRYLLFEMWETLHEALHLRWPDSCRLLAICCDFPDGCAALGSRH